jgi:hypothetical protein
MGPGPGPWSVLKVEVGTEEAAGSGATSGFVTVRFARRCMAIASGEICTLADGVTCAMARGETTLLSNRVRMVRLFVKKCNRAMLSFAILPDVNLLIALIETS